MVRADLERMAQTQPGGMPSFTGKSLAWINSAIRTSADILPVVPFAAARGEFEDRVATIGF